MRNSHANKKGLGFLQSFALFTEPFGFLELADSRCRPIASSYYDYSVAMVLFRRLRFFLLSAQMFKPMLNLTDHPYKILQLFTGWKTF